MAELFPRGRLADGPRLGRILGSPGSRISESPLPETDVPWTSVGELGLASIWSLATRESELIGCIGY